MTRIKFGTDGWRGVIARDVTFANVRRLALATAGYLLETGEAGKGAAVGYDTRFLSREFAMEAAGALAEAGIPTVIAQEPCSTPALSLSVRQERRALGLMITASHNPPHYSGVKIKGPFGGPVEPSVTTALESRIESGPELPRRASATPRPFDPTGPYLEQIGRLCNLKLLRDAGLSLVFDAMHGAGRGLVTHLLGRGRTQVHTIREEENPGFGGVAPEPIRQNLRPLFRAVRSAAADAGLATDGDADRIGLIDETGRLVTSHQLFALVLRHLVENRGLTGAVVRTVSTSHLVDRIAAQHDLPLHETPVGFKHIAALMQQHEVLMGGEESGGFGFGMHLPERDGLLTGLLALEALLAWDQPLSAAVARTVDAGGGLRCERADLHVESDLAAAALERLKRQPPARFAGQAVIGVDLRDGVKFELEGGAWILLRASGTEPLVRIYAEAASRERVEALLQEGKKVF